jgi:hypothetical protein
MKNKVFGRIGLLLPLFAVMSLPACDKLKDDPFYVGSWQYKDKLYVGDLTYNTTRTLTLTKSTYEEIYVIQPDNSGTITSLLGLKGGIVVSGSEMTFKLNAVGECVKDASQKCTGTVEWFAKGSATYNTYLQFLRETINAEFTADEDYLWLVRDMNNDGDMEDAGEDIEFDRL